MLALCAPAVRALAMRPRAVRLRVVCGVLVQRSPTVLHREMKTSISEASKRVSIFSFLPREASK